MLTTMSGTVSGQVIQALLYIYLTAIGLTPGGRNTVHIYTQTVHSSTVHIYTQTVHSSTVHIYTQTVHRIQRTELTKQ